MSIDDSKWERKQSIIINSIRQLENLGFSIATITDFIYCTGSDWSFDGNYTIELQLRKDEKSFTLTVSKCECTECYDVFEECSIVNTDGKELENINNQLENMNKWRIEWEKEYRDKYPDYDKILRPTENEPPFDFLFYGDDLIGVAIEHLIVEDDISKGDEWCSGCWKKAIDEKIEELVQEWRDTGTIKSL